MNSGLGLIPARVPVNVHDVTRGPLVVRPA
jgi:hypothetical protein